MDRQEASRMRRILRNQEESLLEEHKGRLIATLVCGGMFATLVIFNLFKGQDMYAPLSAVWVAIAAKAYPKNRVRSN
ncbi:MAG: DUF6442 family protein [bacterium]|nr:DUF6442 family protein [bacterium]